jgi:hypothetical protein
VCVNAPSGDGDRYPASAWVSDTGELLMGCAAEDQRCAHPERNWSQFRFELSRRQLHLGPCRVSTVDLARG